MLVFKLKKIVAKIKYKLIGLVIDLLFNYFKIIPALIKNQKGVRVIVFHGIMEDNPQKFNSRFITKIHFEAIILLLKKYCHLISYTDFISNNLVSSKLNILISFDDGYKNNFDYAYPFLLKQNIPAVFFVTTCHLNKLPYLFNDMLDILPYYGKNAIIIHNEEYVKTKVYSNFRYVNHNNKQLAKKYHYANLEKRNSVIEQLFESDISSDYKNDACFFELMTEPMIKAIAAHDLFTIGSHSKNHLSLTDSNTDSLVEEINDSVGYLKRITGKEEIPFAFPYGEYNQAVLDICANKRIKYLFGTEIIHSEDHKKISVNRFQLNPFVSPIRQLYYIAKGKYE